jgi:hypothetical protein
MTMKKIILYTLPIFFFLVSCRRESGPVQTIDESQWLDRERGVVAHGEYNCDYYVVETYRGFALLKSWGGYNPYQGSVMYGDFSRYGIHTFYNRSEGLLQQADVREYWLSYWEAMDALDWNCSTP